MKLAQGKHELVLDVERIQYPLKIVVDVANDVLTVITNYPLKKGRKR